METGGTTDGKAGFVRFITKWKFILVLVHVVALIAIILIPNITRNEWHEEPDRVQYWKGAVYSLQTKGDNVQLVKRELGKDSDKVVLSTMGQKEISDPSLNEYNGGVADEIRLLASDEGLWIISTWSVHLFSEGKLVEKGRSGEKLPLLRQQLFAYEGKPAFFDHDRVLRIFEAGSWRNGPTISELPYKTLNERGFINYRVESDGSDYWFFTLLSDETVFVTKGLPVGSAGAGKREWYQLEIPHNQIGRWLIWSAIIVDGKPGIVFREVRKGFGTRLLVRLFDPAGAIDFVRIADPDFSGLLEDLKVFNTGRADEFLLAYISTKANGLLLDKVKLDGKTREISLQSYNRWPGWFAGLMMIEAILLCIVFVFTWIVSRKMEAFKQRTIIIGDIEYSFASLWRRAVAQVIDFSILMIIPVYSIHKLVGHLNIMQDYDLDRDMASLGGLIFVSIINTIWFGFMLLLFSTTEEMSGRTPGKLIAGIKVISLDGKPIGIYRAIKRNLYKLSDGQFNFLPAIATVALSEQWQREGDQKTETIVVDARKNRPRNVASADAVSLEKGS